MTQQSEDTFLVDALANNARARTFTARPMATFSLFGSRGPRGPLPPPVDATLVPLHAAAAERAPILSGSLWRGAPAVVLVLRRPG